MPKRITALKPGLADVSEVMCDKNPTSSSQYFLPFLSDVTSECYVSDVNPKACIPLYLVRDESRNAVEMLKAIINGSSKSNDLFLSGMFSGTPTSIIVALTGDLQVYLEKQLHTKCNTPADVATVKRQYAEWFGVIDGCRLRQAVVELMDELPEKWGSFKWKVIIVRPSSSIDKYTQLARVQNERAKKAFSYECTIYDLLRGLRREYDKLLEAYAKTSRTGTRGARSKVSYKDVAEKYDGGDHSANTSLKQAVSVAPRLSWKAIDAIGEVVNAMCADVIVQSIDLNQYSLQSQEDVLAHQDCRLFKSFVCFGSLCSAKNFMSAQKDGYVDAQVNCIYRMRHWCELNKYRHVQARVISEQFDMSKLALNEELSFLDFIKEDTWPPNMETARDNMLRTTLYDSEMTVNRGNDKDALPSLWEFYNQLFPAKSMEIEQRNDSGSNDQGETGYENQPEPPETQQPPEPAQDYGPNCEAEVEGERARQLEEEARREQEIIVGMHQREDSILNDIGISCFKSTYHAFLKREWSKQDMRADLVV